MSHGYNGFEGFTINPFDFKDKHRFVNDTVSYMLSRTQSMFKYNGLPDTIPKRMFELYLQCNGNCIVAEHNGELYAFTGGLGGVPDPYYRPTIYTVSNPALNLSKMFKIDDDCVLVKNDSMLIGLLPMFEKYATLLAENELSIDIAMVMGRLTALVSASDDKTKASAELVLKRLFDGELGVISENALLEGLKTQPYAGSIGNGYIQNLLEVNQYFKGSWLNEIGLQFNINTKRENLNKNETEMNEDFLLPLIDDMLLNRQESIDLINEKYGTNITVDLAPPWKDEGEIEEEYVIDTNSVQTENIDFVETEPALDLGQQELVNDVGEMVEDAMLEELNVPKDNNENYDAQLELTEEVVETVIDVLTEKLEGDTHDIQDA